MPNVSVLMAAYNAGRYIDKAIDSLKAQTYQDWELVVVDDGSTDDTRNRVQIHAQMDFRIRLYVNEKNLGIGATREKALSLATGVYAAILDSDDIALPQWLAVRVSYLDSHPEVVAVSGARIIIDESGKRQKVVYDKASPLALRWQLLFGNPFCQPSVVFSVQSARQVGGYLNEEYYFEDWSLFARLAEIGKLVHDDLPLMMYRVHTSNSGSTLGRNRERAEGVVACIMKRAVYEATGLQVPPELTWYLFRGRSAFPGEHHLSEKAVDFVLQVYSEFTSEKMPGAQSAQIGAVVLDTTANILRCGGWSFKQVAKIIQRVVSQSGIRSIFSRDGLINLGKLVLAPRRLGSLYPK